MFSVICGCKTVPKFEEVREVFRLPTCQTVAGAGREDQEDWFNNHQLHYPMSVVCGGPQPSSRCILEASNHGTRPRPLGELLPMGFWGDVIAV